jgi:ATP-dependent protease ClpP protease subunit
LSACGNQADAPEPTLDTACPQVKTTKTKIVNSDFPAPRKSDLTMNITGELADEDEGILNSITLFIDTAQSEKKPNIHISVASPGGDIKQGFALKDAIKYYGEDKFVLLCTTSASSATSFIFTTQAKRYALPSCEITTHAVSVNITDESKISDEELNQIKAGIKKIKEQRTKQMRDIYKDSLNLTDTCANFLTRNEDTNLSAYDALKIGFFDAILEPNGMMMIREP